MFINSKMDNFQEIRLKGELDFIELMKYYHINSYEDPSVPVPGDANIH